MNNRSKTPDRSLSRTPNKTRKQKSRSPSYNSSISINRSNINHSHCRGMKFGGELQLLEKQIINNTNKLCSCLQIYAILDGNMQSQRCLQHNNTLSLYCINQRRILCVNCLYGMHKHRSHKVIPLKDCMNLVYEDNEKLRTLIEEEIKRLQYYHKVTQENIIVLQSELSHNLTQMDLEYMKKCEQLKKQYQSQKQQIINNFQPLISQCSSVKTKLDDFRFKIYETYSKYEGTTGGIDDKQIMKQLLFVNIMELCQVRCRLITKHELEHLGRKGRNVTNAHPKQVFV